MMASKARKGKSARKPAPRSAARLSHVDSGGTARMVDVSGKPLTVREAVARGALTLGREAFEAVASNRLAKGDIFSVIRLAGIQAAKETASLIPLCHSVPLDRIEIEATLDRRTRRIEIEARARARWSTGVEMEALTAVTIAGLAAYDMVKGVDRTAVLSDVRLVRKSGGRSGTYRRRGEKG